MAANADNFYGIKQNLVVRDIKNCFDSYPDKIDNSKLWYKHTVIFDCEGLDYKGTFFQKEVKELTFQGKVVKIGDNLCFNPERFINEDFGDKLQFCYEPKQNSSTEEPSQPKVDLRLTKSVSFSYAKDLTIAFFKDKPTITLDEIVRETIKISLEIEKHLLTTNNT